MTFLTDLAGFAAGVASVINSVFTIVDACLSWLYGGIINGTKAKKWGALSFLADHGSVDGAVSVRIHVHTCRR